MFMSSAYFHLPSLSELTLHLRTTAFLWICHVYWYIDCINKFEKMCENMEYYFFNSVSYVNLENAT